MMRRIGKVLAAALGAVVLLALAYNGYVALRLWWWVDHNPGSTAFMQARLAVMQEKNPSATLRHRWIDYDKISVQLKRAVLVAEDDKFVDHEGFDWDGIQKAREKNERKGKVVAGGSTISQQLAKNLFLSAERSFLRKGEEALITVMMERIMDKERILEIYLNVIEWGDGVFGAEAAAQHYYGTSAARLTAEQAARMAAMVTRPRFYDRNRSTPALNRKTQIILERMPRAQLP
ncbi:MAG TPA: monofunctional biosynthetic peptidoglycan transglycosylase [Usitatibacteraceae bacterium]|nr:monofunctional biosynthetic peptidoglycan transglycosylase [Usitatibacteraceae bacterium]